MGVNYDHKAIMLITLHLLCDVGRRRPQGVYKYRERPIGFFTLVFDTASFTSSSQLSVYHSHHLRNFRRKNQVWFNAPNRDTDIYSILARNMSQSQTSCTEMTQVQDTTDLMSLIGELFSVKYMEPYILFCLQTIFNKIY